MLFQVPVVLALSLVSTVLASPLPVEKRGSIDYKDVPSNVLFMFTGGSCSSLQVREYPLAGGVSFSLAQPNELAMQRRQDIFSYPHTYIDLTASINAVHPVPKEMGIKTIVWTIDEPRYNFRAWRGYVGSAADALPKVWLVDVLQYYMAGWEDFVVSADGQDRHFACKEIDQDYVLESFSLDSR